MKSKVTTLGTGYSRVWLRDVCTRVLTCGNGVNEGAKCDGAIEKDKEWVFDGVKRAFIPGNAGALVRGGPTTAMAPASCCV